MTGTPIVQASPPASGVGRDEMDALQAELDSRIAEAEWLKAHYDEQLRSAFAQIASLQARLRDAAPPPAPGADPEEVTRLRGELERLAAAEARYLDRIEELKEAVRLGR